MTRCWREVMSVFRAAAVCMIGKHLRARAVAVAAQALSALIIVLWVDRVDHHRIGR